jgi:hypothetical protein
MYLPVNTKKGLFAQVMKACKQNNITYERRNGYDYYLNLFYTAKTSEYKGIQTDWFDGFISLEKDEYDTLLDAINNYSTYAKIKK